MLYVEGLEFWEKINGRLQKQSDNLWIILRRQQEMRFRVQKVIDFSIGRKEEWFFI